MNWIYEPWPWYVAGPMISLTMFILLFVGKQFGMSSNLRTMCTIGGAGKIADFFNIDWKRQSWNLMIALGTMIGGALAAYFMPNHNVDINPEVAKKLTNDYDISSANQAYLPLELFSVEKLTDRYILDILIAGGFLVGFGARYAGGCTSGHAISGLSNLQVPSLIAVMGFFAGGLIMINFIFPFIFG